MDSLLIEVCTEEIPAGYLEPALNAFSSLLLQRLTEARIGHGNAKVLGTPRRLAVEVKDVSLKQKSITMEVTGPPARVGYDSEGKPTVAAEKFAEKVGIAVSRLKVTKTKKGQYLCAKKTVRGLSTRTILSRILPDVILSIPFPKTMRWADLSIEFARPIHSILALLGKRIIPFTLGKSKSGRYTFGHRFLHPGRIRVIHPANYREILSRAHVMVDAAERRRAVERQINRAAGELGGKVLPDADLVEIVNNLVEYPATVAGRFDTKYLELPGEVLITAMREHQKYFAVVDEKNNLMPCFIAVNNTRAKDMSLVAKGHERVLRARLEDARFFFRSDMEISFEDRIEKLKGVLFQAELGSMHEKVERIESIAGFLALLPDHDSDQNRPAADFVKDVSRAAMLCKADLVSQVVDEFPKLQGVMGRIYAQIAKEPAEVASAIEEHYRPTHSGGQLPETATGAILAIADKIDSICGCFTVGLNPTGTSDPYALRRQGIGIVQIMLRRGFSFSLSEMIKKSLSLFGDINSQEMKNAAQNVTTFLQNRMVHLLAEEGYSKDVIAAVVSVSVDHVPNVWNRVGALEKLKTAPDFQPLAIAFKRVGNIIKQAAQYKTGDGLLNVDERLFQDESESALFSAYRKAEQKVADDLNRGSFHQALLDIASLRGSIDAFFEGVLVMTEDIDIRRNRLALLGKVAALFGTFADFSKIST